MVYRRASLVGVSPQYFRDNPRARRAAAPTATAAPATAAPPRIPYPKRVSESERGMTIDTCSSYNYTIAQVVSNDFVTKRAVWLTHLHVCAFVSQNYYITVVFHQICNVTSSLNSLTELTPHQRCEIRNDDWTDTFGQSTIIVAAVHVHIHSCYIVHSL